MISEGKKRISARQDPTPKYIKSFQLLLAHSSLNWGRILKLFCN